ncbi:MAG: hypothetical protein WDA16_12765 [Candidatus Thermoplasmatota archaeon]
MILVHRPWFATLALATIVLAGCVTPEQVTPAAALDAGAPLGLVRLQIVNGMSFTQSVVKPAVGTAQDLYEPTMEVSDSGTIYVAAHVIGAATTGTPAWFSNDQGKTWAPLPFASSVQAPSPLQGSQPPPGDEGFIVAGEHGQAWMADIYAAGFSITGWCDNGKTQCYDNRQAYDRVGSTTTCTPASLNDRPWAAYANGTLLLVNNPGGGPMQIGVMKVPPSAPVGVLGVNGPEWNMCASKGGDIPGIPAMRGDGRFAVPQMYTDNDKQVLNVIVGNSADISKVETKEAFHVASAGDGTSNGGRTAFDKEGTLFVGARNNTYESKPNPDTNPLTGGGDIVTVKEGRFILAVSTDGGQTFKNATFAAIDDKPLQSLYLDGNMAGRGALLTWSQVGADKTKADWFVAHVFVGPDGAPVLEDVTLAVDEGPQFAAHVMGAAAGPDGRAYFVNFKDAADPAAYAGSTPISVWMQKDGPTLPIG